MMNPNEVIILNKEEHAKDVPLVSKFQEICRLCLLANTGTESTKSIHDEHFNISIKSLLEIYTLLKIPAKEEDDRLPPNICLDCANFLIEMHTFRSRCQVSNDILQKVLKRHREDVQHDPLQLNQQDQTLEAENIQISTLQLMSMRISDVKLRTSKCPDQCKPKTKRKWEKIKLRYDNCRICKKLVSHRQMKKHVASHLIKRHKCTRCNYQTYYGTNMRRHVMRHTGETPHVCSVCGKGFIQLGTLQSHEKTHLRPAKTKKDKQVKSYDCKYCPKQFKAALNLSVHERIHTGDKPYVCDTCGRRFVQNSQLRYHMRTHTGEKQYVCDVCGQAFALNGNLTVHKRIHTGEKPYKCLVCNKAYHDSSNRKKHQESHSKEQLQQASQKLNS